MTALNSGILARIIRQRRIMEGYTQAEIAQISGVSKAQISRVERGVCLPSAEFLVKMAGPLKIETSQLLAVAACVVLNEPSAGDRYLREISGALRYYLPNTKQRRKEKEANLYDDYLQQPRVK